MTLHFIRRGMLDAMLDGAVVVPSRAGLLVRRHVIGGGVMAHQQGQLVFGRAQQLFALVLEKGTRRQRVDGVRRGVDDIWKREDAQAVIGAHAVVHADDRATECLCQSHRGGVAVERLLPHGLEGLWIELPQYQKVRHRSSTCT